MINFIPFPILETENLLLRRMSCKDINDLFKMRKDPRMHEYTDTKPDENTEETKNYIDKINKGIDDNKWIMWAIEHKQSKAVIGTISIWNMNSKLQSAELGYGIAPDYQGRGFMKEALLKVAKYGFDMIGLKVLEAYTEENNLKSIKLLQRCNFIEADRVDDQGYLNDRVYHMIVYRFENNK